MDFAKKFASDAGKAVVRAKQYTEEKMGTAERTPLDSHFENLLNRAETTRHWTEKMISQTEAVIQPDMSQRMEDLVTEKLGNKRDRMTNTEWLGEYYLEAGEAIGGNASIYGTTLIKVGQTEQALGAIEKDFMAAAQSQYLRPLRNFIDGDMKMLQRERAELENRRLDLDAAKHRLKQAKTQEAQIAYENELRIAQSEFDKQCEMMKPILDSITSTHAYHLRCLQELVHAQAEYHSRAAAQLAELKTALAATVPPNDNINEASKGVHFSGNNNM